MSSRRLLGPYLGRTSTLGARVARPPGRGHSLRTGQTDSQRTPSLAGYGRGMTDAHIPGPDESDIPELEDDQTIAPRPEEEIADELRAEPDVADHSVDGDGAAV